MRKNIWKLLSLIIGGTLYSTAAFADIFTELADRAEIVGSGLTSSGYIIAAVGLIVFTFMAIFNKLSWKTLAYIMMCCFILSVMGAIISWVSEGGNEVQEVDTSSASGSSSVTPGSQDPTTNTTKK
ncbi:MAG: hypothetical protein MJ212_00470 [Alphaproteobacteria bacterium]|nr:hypothetical protein [Alphaproteobacteria bacterium]